MIKDFGTDRSGSQDRDSGTLYRSPDFAGVSSWRSGERLAATQALALMKNLQNQRTMPLFINCMFKPEPKPTGITGWLKLNFRIILSGDERDRTANLLVANQALQSDASLFRVGVKCGLLEVVGFQGF